MYLMENKETKKIFVILLGIYFLSLILGALNIGPIGSVLRLIGLVPIAVWIIQVHSIRKEKYLTFVILFVIWCCVSYIWTIDTAFTSKRVITQISFLVLLLAVGAYEYTSIEIDFLKKMLIWSSRLSAIFVLLFSSYIEGRLYLSGLIDEDPNYLCTYFLFAIINVIEQLSKPIGRKKVLYFFELIIYVYIILSTGSRGGALAVGCAVVISYVMQIRKQGLSLTMFIGRVIAVLIAVIAVNVVTSYLSEDILLRYSYATIASSNGTGRYQIWNDAISLFKNSGIVRQFIGYGTGTAKTIAREFSFTHVNVIHNIFIENLIELGIVGFLFYVVYIFRFWNCSRRNGDIYSLSIISGMIIMSLSTSLAAFKPYWNIIIFIICISNKIDNNDEFRATEVE